MASRSALRNPERYISSKAACNRSPRVRSEFRNVARLPRDRFLTADIPTSMHVHPGRRRAKRFNTPLELADSAMQIQLEQRPHGHLHKDRIDLMKGPPEGLAITRKSAIESVPRAL